VDEVAVVHLAKDLLGEQHTLGVLRCDLAEHAVFHGALELGDGGVLDLADHLIGLRGDGLLAGLAVASDLQVDGAGLDALLGSLAFSGHSLLEGLLALFSLLQTQLSELHVSGADALLLVLRDLELHQISSARRKFSFSEVLKIEVDSRSLRARTVTDQDKSELASATLDDILDLTALFLANEVGRNRNGRRMFTFDGFSIVVTALLGSSSSAATSASGPTAPVGARAIFLLSSFGHFCGNVVTTAERQQLKGHLERLLDDFRGHLRLSTRKVLSYCLFGLLPTRE
jgi:hypothetical protein